MQIFVRYFFLISSLNIIFLFTYSQETNSDYHHIINYANRQYGVNNVLVNGKLYFPLHTGAEGHPYYPINDFMDAEVYINNQVFNNVPVKYDIEQQKMIIKDFDNGKSLKLIVLNPKKIDSICFYNKTFIPSNKISKALSPKRYYECIWNRKLQFLIYHHISFNSKLNWRNIIPGGYSDINTDKIIITDDKIVYINNKKAFLRLIESDKKAVREFMKLHKIRYKKADSSQIKLLMQYCYENALFY